MGRIYYLVQTTCQDAWRELVRLRFSEQDTKKKYIWMSLVLRDMHVLFKMNWSSSVKAFFMLE